MSSPCAFRLPPAVGTMTKFFSGPPASSMNFSLIPEPLRIPAADDDQRPLRGAVFRQAGGREPSYCLLDDGGTMPLMRK